MADTKVGRLGVLIVIASFIFIEVIYVYNALSKPRLIIDPKVKKYSKTNLLTATNTRANKLGRRWYLKSIKRLI